MNVKVLIAIVILVGVVILFWFVSQPDFWFTSQPTGRVLPSNGSDWASPTVSPTPLPKETNSKYLIDDGPVVTPTPTVNDSL